MLLVTGQGSLGSWAPDFRLAIRSDSVPAELIKNWLLETCESYGEKRMDLKKMELQGGWREINAREVGWVEEEQLASLAPAKHEDRGMRRSFSTALFGGGERH